MKAEIDKCGLLTIWPENELEIYALNKWYGDFEAKNNMLSSNSLICRLFTKEESGIFNKENKK